jgi:hypothetical protein
MAKLTKINKQQAIIERPTKAEKQQAKAERKQSKAKKKLGASNHSPVQARTEQTCLVQEESARKEISASGCPYFPAEVWAQILGGEELDLKDIKNARLTCRMLAKAGVQRQFHTVAFRRDRQDFQRVEKMLAYDQSQFAKDVRVIRLESGWLDANSMARNLNYGAIQSAKKIASDVDPVSVV